MTSKVSPPIIMKITVEKSKIAPALKNVSRAVSPRNPLPVLTGIKFDASEDGKLTLTATDLEIMISCTIDANVQEPGSVVLPSATVVNLIEKVPSGEVVIEGTNGTATVRYGKTGKSKTEINGFPADEFPEQTKPTTDVKFSVSGESLCEVSSRVSYAALDGVPAKPYMGGVNLEIGNGELILVATDSYRLALGQLALDGIEQKKTVIVPKKTMEEAGRLFRTAKEIAIQIGDNNVIFASEGINMTSRVIDGAFPNYKQVMPKNFEARVAKVNALELINALERVSVLNSVERPIVSLKISEGSIELTSKSERGNARESIEAVTQDEIEIHFNANYLKDSLKNAGEGDVMLGFSSALAPTLVRPVGGGNILSIVLPIRVKEPVQKTAAA